MALAKNARTIVSSQSCGAGSTVRGTLGLQSAQGGGFLTMKITNGGTGPTTQCEGRVLIAHNSSTPSPGGAGSDWKTIASFGGGTANNAVTEFAMPIDASIMCLECEFTGNTGQAVTVEAYFSELTTIN